ncbi:MAG: acetate/propionate family kinase [Candidatus Rokuibacteriota bacterium]
MRVLVLNCGSSSVKFQVIGVDRQAPGGERLARGALERIGEDATLTVETGGRRHRDTAAAPDHDAAVGAVMAWTRAAGLRFDAVGHRVVHGGERFTRPTPLDPPVIAEIEKLEALAPLHNAPSLAGIRAAGTALGPGVPMVAVFDTAFHATLPAHAARYALPEELARRHGVRRYGFHGSSYRAVLARYCALAGTPPERATVVALHLGNGASAVAIRDGRSVDTSMGFTPLEGLVMGTRAGDLDAAVVGHLARGEGVRVEDVERWLNERSGLLGVSGRSRDMAELLAVAREDPRAELAVELFCYRARKYVGAYLAALGGADALIFTGGIGEHAPEVRARITAGMAWCGIALDAEANARIVGREGRITAGGTRIAVFVIPTDEELIIAQDTAETLGGADGRAGTTARG